VTGVNDPPSLSGLTASVFYIETEPAVTLSPSAVPADPDLVLSGATVQITGGKFFGDGDLLTATKGATNITPSYDSASETLTLTGSDTTANYQQVLDTVAFSSSNPNPDNYSVNPTRT